MTRPTILSLPVDITVASAICVYHQYSFSLYLCLMDCCDGHEIGSICGGHALPTSDFETHGCALHVGMFYQ